MELILEAGDCNQDGQYAVDTIMEVARLRAMAPDDLDVLLKVQMYQPDTISTDWAPRYDNTSGDAANQRELFDGAITYRDWETIYSLAKDKGVPMFASVFDHAAIEAAVDMGMDRLKIASGDVTYLELIAHAAQAMGRVDGRVYISTGASDYDDLADLRPIIDNYYRGQRGEPFIGAPGIVLMACHLAYPTTIPNLNMARVTELRHATNNRYPVGYSDHTPGFPAVSLLVGLGVHCWEKHFTLDRSLGGDSDFALDPGEVESLFDFYRDDVLMMGSPNLTPTEAEAPARELARRGIYAKTGIKKGDRFSPGNLIALRPARGARPANELGRLYGKTAGRGYEQGEAI
jgi:sialic acid synthase SpsE